jgi:hypothetical protein
MSGEHVFSECVFTSEFIATEGIAKINPGVRVSRQNIKAKILCTTHNERLSELDSEAKKVSDPLRKHWQSRAPREARVTVDGWKIERWCLKLLHGFIASRWVNDRTFIPAPALVKVVFGEGRLGPSAGLYVVKKPEPMRPTDLDRIGCIVFHDLNDAGSVTGAYTQVQGLGFVIKPMPGDDPTLSLRHPLTPSIGGLDWSHAELTHRPASITLAYHRKAWAAHERARLTIEFTW